ncbi:lysophospholipid acyltransferase family protein [Trichloromonas sp.]|uniref:LpxL/LpxP family acyltransferase n=1 Tax=Trichloromonas sp. TaxID=3069249 RepID=UPI003D812EBF
MQPDEQHSRWSSRSIGSKLQHGIFYFLIRVGGRRAAYALLHCVVLYYVLFCPAQRRKGEPYLRRRFAVDSGWKLLWHSYRMILDLGKVLVDRAVVGILGPEQMQVRMHGKDKLLDLLAENKGLILVGAHVGCWQVAMSSLGFVKVPVNLLMQREDGDIDRHYFEHAGLPCPYRIIDPRGFLGGALEMLEVLKRGEVLSVMGDRLLGSDKNAVEVDFLGGKVRVPFSAYKLASTTGAPVAVLFSYKTGPASYELQLARVIRVPAHLKRGGAALVPYAAEFAGALEKFTLDHPYQFFNFFDMWQNNPTAGAKGPAEQAVKE